MIKFMNISSAKPYLILKDKYDEAFLKSQKNIEAISISSFNKKIDEVDSRFVNLKFIDNDEFIFFSNYKSPKSVAFESHNQIAAILYWSSTDTQIRMKGRIKKKSVEYNKKYFSKRSFDKNALAISSNQSQPISSYDEVKKKYAKIRSSHSLSSCPSYWGGYSFTPYYFEFWEGHESRINKRTVFQLLKNNWKEFCLEP